MTDKELLQQALDALTKLIHEDLFNPAENAIEAIKARLAQSEAMLLQPEPQRDIEFLKLPRNCKILDDGTVVIPQREWQGLTDVQREQWLVDRMRKWISSSVMDLLREYEDMLKEKNNG